jgi:hypothetical protein
MSLKILCALIISQLDRKFSFCFCQVVLDLLDPDNSVTVENVTDT